MDQYTAIPRLYMLDRNHHIEYENTAQIFNHILFRNVLAHVFGVPALLAWSKLLPHGAH